jgi:hypothetical protein
VRPDHVAVLLAVLVLGREVDKLQHVRDAGGVDFVFEVLVGD